MDQRLPYSSDNELKDTVHTWLHSQPKIFFADSVTMLMKRNKYVLKKGGDCVEEWLSTHLSRTLLYTK